MAPAVIVIGNKERRVLVTSNIDVECEPGDESVLLRIVLRRLEEAEELRKVMRDPEILGTRDGVSLKILKDPYGTVKINNVEVPGTGYQLTRVAPELVTGEK